MRRKVLHLHASAILGGTELRAFQIAERLKETFDISVLFHCPPGRICEYYEKVKIPFKVVPYSNILSALRVVRNIRPDVIHIYGLKTNVLWRPLLYSLGYRNLIGHIAGLTNEGENPSWLRVHLDLWTHRYLKIYLSNSAWVAERLASYGFDQSRLRVIHNGVTLTNDLPPKHPHDPPRIISVGNLRPVKGQRYLLDALKQLRDKNIKFQSWFIGTGPDLPALQNLARANGLENQIQFLGELDNTSLLTRLQQSDIFTLMSLSEGVSGATMEAMAQGLPVVVSDVGGIRELVTSGVEGYLVPAKSVSEAADRLAMLLAQPALRAEMGDRAHRKMLTEFNLNVTIQAYEKLYSEN
jgi:glycosyltransferase involved in cell wall biosynthesis